tara:strand:+ start:491 stop:1552 length:1062 start_codon:yes stop_codon:yes gene_type:complete
MNIIIYEDNKVENFKPFSINHAIFELRCGMYTNLDRVINLYGSNHQYILMVRPEIESIIRFRYPKIIVNPDVLPSGKFINGSFLLKNKVDLDFFPDNPNSSNLNHDEIQSLEYIWDCIFYSKEIFKLDFFSKFNSKDIYKSSNCIIKEGVILDASNGPIIIGENVTVDIGALLQGPLFIDNNSYIAPGSKIRQGTMIGKNCKIGGEVSNSIFYANSNKVHDGFIGDSFIGEWVNIGAGTNNSNLKNNYSNISFSFNGKDSINTDHQFLGSMIGDYTRIGISSMLNTGSYIGLGANVFGAGFQKKYIENFSWGMDKQRVVFDKFIQTCEKMYSRRNKKLSEIETNFLNLLYNKK